MHFKQFPAAIHLQRLDLHGGGGGGGGGGGRRLINGILWRSGCPASMTHKLRQMQHTDNDGHRQQLAEIEDATTATWAWV